MKLLKCLLEIQSVSGDEHRMSKFILDFVQKRKSEWNVLPELYFGENFQDAIVLKFGQPRTAVFAHMDTVGFTARYANQLLPIGGPETESGFFLVGQDELGPISCELKVENDQIFHNFPRAIQRGTNLSFRQKIRIENDYIQAAYLDNRLGIYNALKLCEVLKDGVIVFSTYEEHGGGSVPFLCKFIYEQWKIKQALISDITWITEGVEHQKGVAISMRDRYIPRKAFLEKILKLAKSSGIPYQLEVEGHGGSDGREIQMSPYPMDWCFIGAPEDHVHSPDEKVYWEDLESMMSMYRYLMAHL
ncbi:M20/M25/M40 family metallo-hydrolase [Pararhodonellum marinum]|uniref:M20/M25/M40 family metallo-hydrolase n=1 Tax=Pararhodonellum marinum TaxID=2755358 RepID=UPI00188F1E35|nr:M20/M25/M40 family metallo-hydrolase [Pararhodonellum marinum]